MSARSPWRLPAAVSLVVLLLAPALLPAQLTPGQTHAEANRLHAEAMGQATTTYDVAQLSEIARKHGEAARLRGLADPDAYDCKRLQGQLLFQVGQHQEAQGYLVEAGAVALANRDIVSAVTAFVEAAHVASARGSKADVEWLGRLAYGLSRHPSLTRAERAAVEGMFEFRSVEADLAGQRR